MHQVILLNNTSYYFPILLQGEEVSSIKHPFPVENMYLEVEDFVDLVKSFWGKPKVSDSPSFILAKKLNFLNLRLKEWNKEVFGHLDAKMANLADKIKGLFV